jgi:hypothetical protein
MIERHHERPDDIVESGPLDGRDHHGRRHAGIEPYVGHRGKLSLVDPDRRHIIGIVGFRISQTVGRNLNNIAMDNRNDALLVRG